MNAPTPGFDLRTVDLNDGLTDAQIAESRATHGSNEFAPLPTKSAADFAQEAFADPMLRILVACAVVAILVGIVEQNPTEGIAIVCAIAVVTAVSVRNQLKAQRDYTALDAQSSAVATRVIRNGRVVEIDSAELVVGDLLEINTGDVAAADVVLARGKELLVDEKHITGEPDATKTLDETVYAGSRILDGSGRALVAVVGDDTLLGGIRSKLGAEREPTPLEERLEILAGRIGRIGITIAVLTAVVMVAAAAVRGEWFHEGVTESIDFGFNGDTAKLLLFAATAAFTIIVVAVPEGLPLAVTLALSYTTRRMASDSILVRELPACETMGAGTIICTDKTGTLTEGSMSLAYVWVGGTAHDATEASPELSAIAGRTMAAVTINASADLTLEDGKLRVLGNATEGGVLSWMDPEAQRYRDLRDQAEILERREFSSTRKHMATLVADAGGPILHLKGAPEIVVQRCTALSTDADLDGPTTPLDEAGRTEIVNLVKGYASRGYRTLAIAAARTTEGTSLDEADQDLTFLALFVLADPIRPEVPHAVANCKSAGVDVMIITGDIPETAAEIGRQAGIVESIDNVVDGSTFREMDDATVKSTVAAGRMQALARALPEDKERLVGLLQDEGHVVGMTGDGVNDAPALKKADIGFAMGSGSQVAREASDVVIVDDNFVSLVSSIRWGRSVFENIRKFVQFQLTVNVVALLTAFTAALFGFGTPLNAVQLLWVNLIMDSFAALALALEPPTDKLFDQKPHGRAAPLISRQMWINIGTVALAMFATMMLILNTPGTFDLPTADTFSVELSADQVAEADEDGITLDRKIELEQNRERDVYRDSFLFNVFVWMQLFNAFNARSIRADRTPYSNLRKSSSFLAIIALIVVLQVVIMFVGGSVFSIVPLEVAEWIKSVLIGALVIPIGFAMRAAGRAIGTPADE